MKSLEVAFSQVGYLEKASNKDLDDFTANAGNNNYTKYARDINLIADYFKGNKQGAAWCAVFVNWCLIQAYGASEAKAMTYQPSPSYGASCTWAVKYYKDNIAFSNKPRVGDQIFFSSNKTSPTHTGLVYDIDDTYVYTVEGNISDASGKNGVYKKQYRLNDPYIYGYGMIDYTKLITIELNKLSKGSKGEQVQSLQQLLIAKGFSCGKYGDDGDFGNATKEAVIAYQTANPECGKPDGIAGEKTWRSILGA